MRLHCGWAGPAAQADHDHSDVEPPHWCKAIIDM